MRSPFLALRPWRLLCTRACLLPRRRLLNCRAPLLRNGLGWHGSLHVFALRPLCARNLRAALWYRLRRRLRPWSCPLLIMLSHYSVARLVTVMLIADHPLVLSPGIPVAGIVPLVNR